MANEDSGQSIGLADIKAPPPPPLPDPRAEVEAIDLAKTQFYTGATSAVLGILNIYKTGLNEDRESRKTFRERIYWLVVGWLASVVVILFLCAFNCTKLPDAVLIALITGSTLNVLSLLGTVVAYLFARKSETESITTLVTQYLTNDGKDQRPPAPL